MRTAGQPGPDLRDPPGQRRTAGRQQQRIEIALNRHGFLDCGGLFQRHAGVQADCRYAGRGDIVPDQMAGAARKADHGRRTVPGIQGLDDPSGRLDDMTVEFRLR